MWLRRIAIASGVCALVWLAGLIDQAPPGASALDVTSLALGQGQTCARTATGGVKCWGRNNFGELGDGTTTQRTRPVGVLGLGGGPGEPDVDEIAAGSFHGCALTSAGGVKCWGRNGFGEVGDGTTTERDAPIDVIGLTSGAASAGAGTFHSCAVTDAGGARCWGSNSHGQLGDGTTANRSTPVSVTGLTNAISLAGGESHTCALTSTPGVKCWGKNSSGQLGDGTGGGSRATPVDVLAAPGGAPFSDAMALAAGSSYTCALTTAGGVKCWGSQGGPTPTDIAGLTSGIAAIAGGSNHTCVLTAGGGVRCWGANSFGQLGDGTLINSATPVQVVGLESGVIAIGAGKSHSCAALAIGDVTCWGLNANGQLGNGTTTNSSMPVAVLGLGPRVSIDTLPGGSVDASRHVAPGESFSVAVRVDDLSLTRGLASFDVQVSFDDAVLDAISITPGSLFNAPGLLYECAETSAGGGTARLACAYSSPPLLPAPEGTGDLALISFAARPTAHTATLIRIEAVTLTDVALGAEFSGLTTANGTVTVEFIESVAGGGSGRNCDDSRPQGCPAGQLNLGLRGLAPGDSFFVSDALNHVIRHIDPDTDPPTSFRVAGAEGVAGFADGFVTAARFNQPAGLDIDRQGNLYVADLNNHRIRKITPAGLVTTIAGTGVATGSIDGASGSPADDLGNGGPATSATLSSPSDVAVDAAGDLYVADTANCRVRKIAALTGIIETIAGAGGCGFNGDGEAASTQLNQPQGVAVEPFIDASRPASVLVSDTENDLVRRVAGGQIVTIAGGGLTPESCAGSTNAIGDGCLATEATLQEPRGLTVGQGGNIFFANSDVNDSGTANNRVRKIDAIGIITTVAGEVDPTTAPCTQEPCPATNVTLETTSDVILDDGIFAVTDRFVKHIFAGGDVRSRSGAAASPCSPGGSNAGDTLLMVSPLLGLIFASGGWRRLRARRWPARREVL